MDTEEKKKGKMKGLRKFLVFLVVVAVFVVALGFLFPGLIWTRNLGVDYTKDNYKSVLEKLGYVKDETPTGTSADEYTYTYGEVKSVDVEFTSEEITAFFNENRPSYYALKNVQVKINDDGTIEATANADVDYFLNNLLGGDYSREQIEQRVPALGILPSHVNIYLKASGSVTNNKSNVNIIDVSVQGITLPDDLIDSSEAKSAVDNGLDSMMSSYNTKTGSSFNNISIINGNIKFQGSVPSSLERIQK